MSGLLQIFVFGPRIYTLFSNGGVSYNANIFEVLGSLVFTLTNAFSTLCISFSPIFLPYLLIRYDYFSILEGFKIYFAIYSAALFLRSLGRIINAEYRKFASLLFEACKNPTLEARNRLKLYDYECSVKPISDYEVNIRHSKWFLPQDENEFNYLPHFFQFVLNGLAYWVVNSFGRRLLYPGSLSLLKAVLNTALINGRKKHLINGDAQRNIIKTDCNNYVDTLTWDRRGKTQFGNTLVICFEGNIGFYEIGITSTPNALLYSVLGWNTPGFGESTGYPFPEQITSSTEAVMQFAINKLGFAESQIVLYGWSIGGFPSTWAAANYLNIKALILDATFDDLAPLAINKMPKILSLFIHYAVRKFFNLQVAQQLRKYRGPLLVIRRWNEEILIEENITFDARQRRASNRANFLLIDFLRHRYEGLIRDVNDEKIVLDWLEIDTQGHLAFFNYDDPIVPPNLESLDRAKRSILIRQLCSKHFVDFEASHNVPLDTYFFTIPKAVVGGNKFPGVGHVIGKEKRKNSRDSIQTLSSISSSTEND